MCPGKKDWGGCRKRRQRDNLRNENWCDKQAAFFQPNRDPGGVITCIRRQKHAEDGKQQQDDDPELKILLHKLIIARLFGDCARPIAVSGISPQIRKRQECLERNSLIRHGSGCTAEVPAASP